MAAGSAAAAPVAVLAATYTVPTPPTTLVQGASAQVSVQVTNTGNEVWPAAGANPVNLTYHWCDAAGATPVVWDGLRTPLGADVAPAATRGVTATVALPASAGTYQLGFALVKEGVAWFAPGSPTPLAALAPF